MPKVGRLLCLVLFACAAQPAWSAASDLDERRVLDTIEKAKQRLIDAQLPDGSWADPRWNHEPAAKIGGHTALCTYALLQAGVNPSRPVIRKAAEALARTQMYGTYNVSLRCMVFAKLTLTSSNPAYRKVLLRDAEFLVRTNLENGQWTYVAPNVPKQFMRRVRHTGDNSNSQLAVLALREAYYAGAEVPRKLWQKLEKYWSGAQQPDGGWHYGTGRNRSYGSMTAAGLATSFILMDVLHSGRCCRSTRYRPTELGLGWMRRNFQAGRNPNRGGHWLYYLYGVERVGEASGYRYFGRHDWFAEGAAALLTQAPDGNWPGSTRYSGTAFGLLFLARGVAPVMFNKLDFGKGWNANPRDVANVTRYLSQYKFERPLNWQIVTLDSPAEDWHDSPVLFVSTFKAPKFSEAHADKIKAFIDRGGTVWFDLPCKSSTRAADAVERFARRAYPGLRLRNLPADHPVYSVHFKIKKQPKMKGLSNGCRELILFSRDAVSCAWQRYQYASARPAFELAGNVYLYAADKQFRSKLAPHTELARSATTPTEKIIVAHVKHDGTWNPCPTALRELSRVMAARTGVGLDIRSGVTFRDPALAECRAAFLTGLGPLELEPEDRAGLEQFIQGGGMLLVAPAMGDEAFADSAVRLIAEVTGEALSNVPPEDALIRGTFAAHRGFDVTRVRFTRNLRVRKRRNAAPMLKGVRRDGRWVVIYTPFDLVSGMALQTPYNGLGYAVDDASRVATNAFLAAIDAPVKAN